MAGTHATIGNDLGKFARVFRVLRLMRNGGASVTIDGLDQLQIEVEAIFDEDDAHNKVLAAFMAYFNGCRAAVDGMVRGLRGVFDVYAMQVLRPDIGSSATAVDDLVDDLAENMLIDAMDVLEVVITTSAVTADADNTGNGTLIVHDQEPIEKRDNDRIQASKDILQCTTDLRRGASWRSETFNWQSDLHGNGPTVTVGGKEGATAQRIDNGSFDGWTAGVPDNFTYTTDTGTDAEETSLIYRTYEEDGTTAASAFKYTASGAATTLDMRQLETAFVGYSSNKLKPLGVYLLSVYARRGAAADIDGTVTIGFVGTGYTAGSGETISLTTLTTSYVLKTAVVVMPKSIPSDMAIQVLWNGTPTSGRILYLDDLNLQEMTYWEARAMYAAIVSGSTDFIAGPEQADYMTFNTTRPAEGTSLFQEFVTLLTDRNDPLGNQKPDLNTQLPHASAAHASYAESKAT